jgi:hypothetical protein
MPLSFEYCPEIAHVRRELERNLPPGGVKPEPIGASKPRVRSTKARCWLMLGAGLLMFFAGAFVLQVILRVLGDPDATSASRLWFREHPNGVFIPLILILPGGTIASFGFLGLIGHSHPRLLTTKPVPETPSYGPTLKDFTLDRNGDHRRTELLAGAVYGYVDPEAQYHYLKSSLAASGCMGWLLLAPVPLAVLLPARNTPDFWIGLAVLLGFCFALAFWMLLANRSTRARMRSVGDRFTREGEELVVTREGVGARYPWPPAKVIDRKGHDTFLGCFEELVNSEGRYRLDRRYLIEIPPESEWTMPSSRSREAASSSTSRE